MPGTRTIYLGVFLGCLALLALGYYLEYVEGLEPCPLCLIQRLFFALVASTAFLAFLQDPQGARINAITYLKQNA